MSTQISTGATSPASLRLPSQAADDAPAFDPILYLTSIAIVTAGRHGLPVEVQRSDRSEAVYVKVRRGDFWFGLRIASHVPYYASSADCQQILVPFPVASADDLATIEQELVSGVIRGGLPIADPQEVAEALVAGLRTKRHGLLQCGPNDTLWRWDETSLGWRLLRLAGRAPASAERAAADLYRPASAPRIRLSGFEQSQIRHRLNHRARWSYDLANPEPLS